jgi:hypothetical protein
MTNFTGSMISTSPASSVRRHFVHQVAGLGGEVNGVAVVRDQHALGLGAGRHLLHDPVARHVDDGERRGFLLGNIEPATLFIDTEGLRARAGLDLADDRELDHVQNLDQVVVAAGDIELGVIGAEMQVARTAAGLDVLDDLEGGGIDDNNVVGGSQPELDWDDRRRKPRRNGPGLVRPATAWHCVFHCRPSTSRVQRANEGADHESRGYCADRRLRARSGRASRRRRALHACHRL